MRRIAAALIFGAFFVSWACRAGATMSDCTTGGPANGCYKATTTKAKINPYYSTSQQQYCEEVTAMNLSLFVPAKTNPEFRSFLDWSPTHASLAQVIGCTCGDSILDGENYAVCTGGFYTDALGFQHPCPEACDNGASNGVVCYGAGCQYCGVDCQLHTGLSCGDGVCSGAYGENCGSCPADCVVYDTTACSGNARYQYSTGCGIYGAVVNGCDVSCIGYNTTICQGNARYQYSSVCNVQGGLLSACDPTCNGYDTVACSGNALYQYSSACGAYGALLSGCSVSCNAACACGNGVCEPAYGENCNTCGDCACTTTGYACNGPGPGPDGCGYVGYCGDGGCNNGEDCSSCPGDCGSCGGNPSGGGD